MNAVQRVNAGIAKGYTKKGVLELIQKQRKADKSGKYFGWVVLGIDRGESFGAVITRLDVYENGNYYKQGEHELLIRVDNYDKALESIKGRTQQHLVEYIDRTVNGWEMTMRAKRNA